jgi:hypothetical protein
MDEEVAYQLDIHIFHLQLGRRFAELFGGEVQQ